MTALFIAVLALRQASIRSRLELAAEILALRHQLAVLQRAAPKRRRLRPIDRLLWMLLSSVWPNWRQALQIMTPATVVRLASARVHGLLALELATPSRRSAGARARPPNVDSADAGREPVGGEFPIVLRTPTQKLALL